MKQIRWGEPKFDQDDLSAVSEVIKSEYINEGPKTKEFEEELKKYLSVKHVIFTTNATAALFLAIKAEAMLRGISDFEVIIPDLTMIATATSVGWAGGKPILVDIEKEKFTIDLNKVEERINEKTIGIIPVHIIGRAVNMDKLEEIAKKHNISIIEDAAGALGSKYNGKFLGTIGKAGVFSLQSNKIITCGQGGIIVTNDDKLYELIRRLRDFGRLSNKEFIHEIEGYNLKFNDLSAALAFSQFKKIDSRIVNLKHQRELYENLLKEVNQVKFPKLNSEEVPLWIDALVENRKELVEFLKSKDISTRECWPAIHMNPPYSNQSSNNFENSTEVSNNTIWLPNGPSISDEDINIICEEVKNFYK